MLGVALIELLEGQLAGQKPAWTLSACACRGVGNDSSKNSLMLLNGAADEALFRCSAVHRVKVTSSTTALSQESLRNQAQLAPPHYTSTHTCTVAAGS